MKQQNLKEKNNMKRKIRNLLPILAAVLTVAAGLCSTSVVAFAEDDVCSAATLNGSYGTQSSGSILAGGPIIGPIAEAGTITFDGVRGVSQITTVSLAGQIIPNRPSLSGSYQVYADCTGDLEVVFAVPGGTTTSMLHFVIVDQGKEILLVNTGTG